MLVCTKTHNWIHWRWKFMKHIRKDLNISMFYWWSKECKVVLLCRFIREDQYISRLILVQNVYEVMVIFVGFEDKQAEQLVSLAFKLLLQMKQSVTRVPVRFIWGAGQARVGRLNQKHFAGHRFYSHLAPCREVHRPMHPKQRRAQRKDLFEVLLSF